ncbi:GNAT family N-acetyltransferase [Anaerorhabdus sp.]|uniref:GNAT family N-acetyltransferase n=1 Tax=Anaerorhabdus sp. TaxID=1872524 RepID=UPI002FCAE0AA
MINIKPMTLNDLTIFKKWIYTPHVAKWYLEPLDWITEIEQQEDTFSWIHHYIVEYNNKQIGFCQYYACIDSDELWEGYTALGGSYSIDYMIGESCYLGQGLGKQIILALIQKIKEHSDAKRIVVQPDEENNASRGVLRSCGFDYDLEKDIYVMVL